MPSRHPVRGLVRGFVPPLVWSAAARLVRSGAGVRETDRGEGRERDASWYDNSFSRDDHWRAHYTHSRYYFLWSVIADRLSRAGVVSVLDIGCGPGQMAHLLHDRGLEKYRGIDFSEQRIAFARHVCPGYSFEVGDFFESDSLRVVGYDAVLCTEVLEHVERDLELLDRIRSGAKVFATVPNFPFASHVRHFRSVDEVRERYAQRLASLSVDALPGDPSGTTYFLLEGVKS